MIDWGGRRLLHLPMRRRDIGYSTSTQADFGVQGRPVAPPLFDLDQRFQFPEPRAFGLARPQGQAAMYHPLVKEMLHTWYVTFEVKRDGTLLRKRSPRETRTFAAEAEAKDFARAKLQEGRVVFAGTLNPHSPKQIIPSSGILSWLGEDDVNPDVTENQ